MQPMYTHIHTPREHIKAHTKKRTKNHTHTCCDALATHVIAGTHRRVQYDKVAANVLQRGLILPTRLRRCCEQNEDRSQH